MDNFGPIIVTIKSTLAAVEIEKKANVHTVTPLSHTVAQTKRQRDKQTNRHIPRKPRQTGEER